MILSKQRVYILIFFGLVTFLVTASQIFRSVNIIVNILLNVTGYVTKIDSLFSQIISISGSTTNFSGFYKCILWPVAHYEYFFFTEMVVCLQRRLSLQQQFHLCRRFKWRIRTANTIGWRNIFRNIFREQLH
jgi:hypothetical protein